MSQFATGIISMGSEFGLMATGLQKADEISISIQPDRRIGFILSERDRALGGPRRPIRAPEYGIRGNPGHLEN